MIDTQKKPMKFIAFSSLIFFLLAHPSVGEPWLETISLVTDGAAGNEGNSWGGHQCRIVRTDDGVFTAYMVDSKDEDGSKKRWRLAKADSSEWTVIAEDVAGKSPMNLLASPEVFTCNSISELTLFFNACFDTSFASLKESTECIILAAGIKYFTLFLCR